MNAVATLQGMGLTLTVTTDGKLALDGLGRLSNEEREISVTLAKQRKAEIIDHLSEKPGGSFPRPTLPPWCNSGCAHFQLMELGDGSAWCIDVTDERNWRLSRIDTMIGCPKEVEV